MAICNCSCSKCLEDPNWMYAVCSACGGEFDAEGNCPHYCDQDSPPDWLDAIMKSHHKHEG